MPATVAALRVLCLTALACAACAHSDVRIRVPDWIVAIDAELSRAPPPGLDRPIPTELRVYALRSLGAFESASYEQLQDGDLAVLGPSLVAAYPDRIFLYPARPWRAEFALADDARFVAVVAFLHKPVGRSWAYVAALPPGLPRGAMVTPEQLAARPTGFHVIVGPDRVIGRPRFSPAPSADRRRTRAIRKRPSIPRVPTIPSIPSIPTLPSTPTPPSAPTAPAVAAPTAPRLPSPP